MPSYPAWPPCHCYAYLNLQEQTRLLFLGVLFHFRYMFKEP